MNIRISKEERSIERSIHKMVPVSRKKRASIAQAIKAKQKASVARPNKETLKAIRDIEKGKVIKAKNAKDLFKKLGI